MDDKKRKLYYVDSVKPIDKGENFIVRLLSQESYSFKTDKEEYIKVRADLIDEQLIKYYREQKKINFIIGRGRENGFRDGVFIRLNEDKKQQNRDGLMCLSSKDLAEDNIEFYSSKNQQDELPELQVQKYKKQPVSNRDIQLNANSAQQEPALYCFNVGQGDMSLFISSEGHAFVIDTYLTDSNKGKTLAELKNILDERPIEALILTHRHFDHYAGVYLLLKDNDIKVKSIIVNQSVATGKQPNQIDKLLNEADKIGCDILAPTQLTISDGNTKIYFSFHHGNTDENDNSTLIQIYYQDKLYYLTGDMGFETLEKESVVPTYKELVLKVSHHGSRTGTSCKFLYDLVHHKNCAGCQIYNYCAYKNEKNEQEIKNPQAFIFVGKNNRYNHPHHETIDKLKCWDFVITESKKLKSYKKY